MANQYFESPNSLPEATKTFARMIAGLMEEAEAINLYEQRLAVEPDEEARKIIANSQNEEMKHFSMDLEFLLRQKPNWRLIAEHILFNDGDIVQNGEEAEEHIMSE